MLEDASQFVQLKAMQRLLRRRQETDKNANTFRNYLKVAIHISLFVYCGSVFTAAWYHF